MSERRYLNLLIFCSILLQGIIGTILEDNHENSSDLHVRKKRVINLAMAQHREWSITDVPYIVKVLEKGIRVCIGIIVSPELILTVEMCANGRLDTYTILSGQPFVTPVKTHRVIHKYTEGHLILLVIRPFISINYPSLNRNILPYDQPIPEHAVATVTGWGPTIGRQESLNFRRAENVPVVSNEMCSLYYRMYNIELTNDNTCALDAAGDRGFSILDLGSALVLDDKLVGVLIYAGRTIRENGPDVFLRVNNDTTYNAWLKSYIRPYLHVPVVQHPHIQNLHNQHSHNQQPYNLHAYGPNPHSQHPYNQHSYNQHSYNQSRHNQYQHPHTSRNPHSASSSNEQE